MNTSSTTRCHNICSDMIALSLTDPGSKLLSVHQMINTTRQCNHTSFYFCRRFSLSGPVSLLHFLLFVYMGRGHDKEEAYRTVSNGGDEAGPPQLANRGEASSAASWLISLLARLSWPGSATAVCNKNRF